MVTNSMYYQNNNEYLPSRQEEHKVPPDGSVKALIMSLVSFFWPFAVFLFFLLTSYFLFETKMFNGFYTEFCKIFIALVFGDIFGRRKVAIAGAVISTFGLFSVVFLSQSSFYYSAHIFCLGQAFLIQDYSKHAPW